MELALGTQGLNSYLTAIISHLAGFMVGLGLAGACLTWPTFC